ncbi:dihydrolipoyl dehydrogenase [Spiroplasma endosymbiont of Othius punctulatus]|uniref:dihydrolipoyl dehydrogenase n=1 Tax=Spiroplasma endosymbiont of Othius punctulatus TaxID=3066289 RepID=UPI0030D058EE
MYNVKFADIGEGLTEGKVVEVLVKVGQTIKEGDPLFFVETDKVNSEIPSPVAGVVSQLNIKENQEIKVGDIVVVIDNGTGVDIVSKPSIKAVADDKEENASVVGSTPVSNDVIPSRGPKPNQTQSIQPQTNNIIVDKEYDVIVVGAGIGGYMNAIKCAQLGLSTLIIEKEYYGGVCLNVGCIPTKSLLRTAKIYTEITKKAASLGIVFPSDQKPTIDWKQSVSRKNDVVSKLTNGVQYLLKKNGVDREFGIATPLEAKVIEVNGKKFRGKNIVIATGSVPIKLPLPGFEEARSKGILIDSTSILSLKEIPKSLTIIGGGVIGIEFGCLFASLGTKVTVIEGSPTIIPQLDEEVIELMTAYMRDRYSVTILTNAKVNSMDGNTVSYEFEGSKNTVTSDFVLESVGRKVVTSDFDKVGVELTTRGAINANEYSETNIEGVYAIGDVVGKAMLAQVAAHAAVVTANRIAMKAGKKGAEDMIMDYSKVPSCIYSQPEIAMIGRTEQDLRSSGVEYKAFKFPFSAIGKALADDHVTGFVKLIVEPKYKTILGAHIIGNRATDMISEITTLIECEGTITELARSIHPHPTMSEAIGEAAEALESGKAINF